MAEEVYIEGLSEVEVHQLYRATDFLLEASEEIQREVFWAIANLLNLDVDVIFLDTTTTYYFEIEGEDPDGLRRWGRGQEQPRLAQALIGFAVTRSGIPVRCWVWPGNTADSSVVEEVN